MTGIDIYNITILKKGKEGRREGEGGAGKE